MRSRKKRSSGSVTPATHYLITNLIESSVVYPDEIFKKISRAPSYEVSNYGRVRSIVYQRYVRAFYCEYDGYTRVTVWNKKGNRMHIVLEHEMMRLFDHPHKPYLKKPGHYVWRKDNNPHNCRLNNLVILRRDGKDLAPVRIKKGYGYTLHPDRVRAIRYDLACGISIPLVADKHKVNYTTVYKIARRLTHNDVK